MYDHVMVMLRPTVSAAPPGYSALSGVFPAVGVFVPTRKVSYAYSIRTVSCVGNGDGSGVGTSEGWLVGKNVGSQVGGLVGSRVGADEGCKVGSRVGADEGCKVGPAVGASDGSAVGAGDGGSDGSAVG